MAITKYEVTRHGKRLWGPAAYDAAAVRRIAMREGIDVNIIPNKISGYTELPGGFRIYPTLVMAEKIKNRLQAFDPEAERIIKDQQVVYVKKMVSLEIEKGAALALRELADFHDADFNGYMEYQGVDVTFDIGAQSGVRGYIDYFSDPAANRTLNWRGKPRVTVDEEGNETTGPSVVPISSLEEARALYSAMTVRLNASFEARTKVELFITDLVENADRAGLIALDIPLKFNTLRLSEMP